MNKATLFLLAVCVIMLTSCDSYLQGMGTGMGTYGTGMGMYYNPYATPIGVLPYHLRPDVYAANAHQQAMAKIKADNQQMAESAKRMHDQIAAEAAYRVANGMPPVTTVASSPSSSGSTSTSYSTNTRGTSTNQIGRDCPHCLGSGRCKTCNGTGWVHRIGVGHDSYCSSCTNHNGQCAWCSGSGKR